MSGICVVDDFNRGHIVPDEHCIGYWWDFPKDINIHENKYIDKMAINPEIKEPSSVKKDDKGLDKLFALCDTIPSKFKTKKEYMQWVEQGD